jgi:hypothetical protein
MGETKMRSLIFPVVALMLSSCSGKPILLPETVSDMEWCHPFKDEQGIDLGAACDRFLRSDPHLLNAEQWKAKQDEWRNLNGVVECTSSQSMISLKVFVEDTCSQVPCDPETKAMLVQAAEKLSNLGVKK